MPARLIGAAIAVAYLAAPNDAAPHPPQSHPPALAQMSADDVLRAMRCPPPLACKQDAPPPKQKQFR